MTRTEYLSRIREYLHDPEAKVWDDEEILLMLDDAAEEYCRDVGIFRGKFFPFSDISGNALLPDDYLGFVAGWNNKHLPVISVSSGDLSERYGKYELMEGVPEYIYEDLNSIGSIRLCPNPSSIQNLETYIPEQSQGVMVASGYGIPDGASHYGIPVRIQSFTASCEVHYIRRAGLEEIHDYTALIYHVLYAAYGMDSDFHDADKSALFYKQYQLRVAVYGNLRSRKIQKQGNFF